jgi:hypothetical protein
VYGNFVKDQLDGIGLVDDGKIVKIGVWAKNELNGIGYEWDRDRFLWKMVRWRKGAVM